MLSGALLAVAAYFLLLTFIPQAPSDQPGIDRWLVETSSRLGPTAETLHRLGLLSLADSALPRLVFSVLAFVLIVRVTEGAETLWRSRGHSSRSEGVLALLAHAGALVLLVGLLIGQVWGWRVSGLIEGEGTALEVPGHGQVTLVREGARLGTDQPGVDVYVAGSGPQLTVRAVDEEGNPLGLQRSPREPYVTELTLPITPDAPEVYFAIPQASLVVRGTQRQAEVSAAAPILLQIFRAQSGELAGETELVGEALTLSLEQARLQLTRSAYRILAVARDPGRWVKAAGIVLGAVALLGLLAKAPLRAGRWRRAALVVRLLAALLTLAVAALALRNLVSGGTLWDRSSLQAGLSALWAAALAAETPQHPEESQEKGEEE